MIYNKKIIITFISIFLLLTSYTVFNLIFPTIKGLEGYKEIINYKGESLTYDSFFNDSSELEYLGRTEDKDFNVYGYKNNDYLLTLVGADNTNSYKSDKITIPTSGDVTKVFLDPSIRNGENKVIKTLDEIEMFKKLISYEGEENNYDLNNLSTEGTEIYFAYNNCPVTNYNNLVGYIAYIDNSWILVSSENYRKLNKEEYSNKITLPGKEIKDNELIQWLNKIKLNL